MLGPINLPPAYRGLVTDEKGNGLCFRKGSHFVVDDDAFPWVPGARVVYGRVLVIESASVKVDGDLRVSVVGTEKRGARQPRVTAQAAEVTALRGAPFVRLLAGARGILHNGSRFEARRNAQADLHDDASGTARDETVIFFKPSSRGEVLVLNYRVRLVPPPGFHIEERDTKRGIIAKLAR
jgi:hypothetical protein